MTVWYTSDLHLGHKLVAGLRGFGSPAEHDAAIFAAWGSRVRESDLVFVLGDLTLRNPVIALPQLNNLPGRKRCILGNHDKRHPMHRDAHKYAKLWDSVFETTDVALRRRIAGQNVLLSHFPYAGTPDSDHTQEDRYTQWRLPDEGLWLLHGHTHLASQRLHDGRQIHVGLDAWGLAPVSEDEIAATIEGADRG